MDENKLQQIPSKDDLLEDILAAPKLDQEIGVDEHAIAMAGLTHPSDLELERIMQEVLSEVRAEEEAARKATVPEPQPVAAEPEIFKDDEFRAAFGEGESLSQIFNDNYPAATPVPPVEPEVEAAPEQEIDEEEPPVEKGRPQRKKGSGLFGLPHLAATAVWLLIIFVIGTSIGVLAWRCASDVLALGREPITASVTIENGDDIDTIAKKLQDAGLIEYPGIFKFYASITDAQKKIKPGTYNFSAVNEDNETIVYDYMALVSVMSPSGNRLTVVDDLRIPEGYTCAQIFKLLEEKKVCTAKELEEYVASISPDASAEGTNPVPDYWFLEGVKWGDKYSLEGYLFPDTYDFYENDDPARVIKKMLDGFDNAFTDVMHSKLEQVDGYTFRELMIIASMIEKESASNAESFTVSSVIFNRLNNPAQYPYLNIDATLIYYLGKQELTDEDLTDETNPYNTYTHKGLPPGPISNPSQNSIAAALDPENTGYFYYAYDPATKLHHFSKTYAEHLAFLESLKKEAA